MSDSSDAQKLLELITAKAKARGAATMPELHEACGVDVEGMYRLLEFLREAGRISIEGEYPFEQIRPVAG